MESAINGAEKKPPPRGHRLVQPQQWGVSAGCFTLESLGWTGQAPAAATQSAALAAAAAGAPNGSSRAEAAGAMGGAVAATTAALQGQGAGGVAGDVVVVAGVEEDWRL